MPIAAEANLATYSSPVGDLLGAAGVDPAGLALDACPAGRNNRVFLVTTVAGKFIAKHYYNSTYDDRDRLAAEWAFLSYAASIGIPCVPKPICRNVETRIGIYEFIRGRSVRHADLGKELLQQASNFFLQLNCHLRGTQGNHLPMASEACFTIEEQIALVTARVQRLLAIDEVDGEGADAARLAGDIVCLNDAIQDRIRLVVARDAERFAEPLEANRCISPSDFGFHNALIGNRGKATFLDFEYAGWDDPAKMAADFFAHPGMPVDFAYFDEFVENAFRYSQNGPELVNRTRLLRPLIHLKWCCIMLNEFLPDSIERRRFANPAAGSPDSRRRQIDKIGQFLKYIRRLLDSSDGLR